MKVYDLAQDTEQDKNYKPVKTFQDAFNHIVNHLLVQNRSATEYGGTCKYRVFYNYEEPGKCAVGCLISDINYHESIEDSLANNAEVINAIKKSNPELVIDDKLTELFLLMQFVHDHLDPVNWIYMSFLVWRDMNNIISCRTNHSYENIEDFPEIDDYIGQRDLYKKTAEIMALADVRRVQKGEWPNHKKIMRDIYLDQLNSESPVLPTKFFQENRILFESLTKKYS